MQGIYKTNKNVDITTTESPHIILHIYGNALDCRSINLSAWHSNGLEA